MQSFRKGAKTDLVAPEFDCISNEMELVTMAEKVFTIAEVAIKIDVPARTIRKVLRNAIEKDAQPGKGGRWVIREKDIQTLTDMCKNFTQKSATIAELS